MSYRVHGYSPTGAHMSLPICSRFFQQQKSPLGAVDVFYTTNHQRFVRKTVPSASSELEIMLLVSHASNTDDFVRLVMYVPVGDLVEMYFPYNEGGDLFADFDSKTAGGTSRHEKLQFQYRAIQIMIQVAMGVKFLHEDLNLVHRDIKMENIFLNSDGSVCIGDFGFACHIGTQLTATGTFSYLSPEMIPGEPYTNHTAADIYAMAVMFFVMLVGSFPPWQRENDGDKTFGQGFLTYYGPHNIKEYTDKYNELPLPFTDFLTKMLGSSPKERPDITVFLQDLILLQEHAWRNYL
jgi:serine/threonine protein kinase